LESGAKATKGAVVTASTAVVAVVVTVKKGADKVADAVDAVFGDDEPSSSTPVKTPAGPKPTTPAVGTNARQGEFDAFGARAQNAGLVENPNRPGSWGKIGSDGKFREVTRIDVAEAGKPGFRGQTHIHINGTKGHLDPATKIPGEK
jgi:hypothetical protein